MNAACPRLRRSPLLPPLVVAASVLASFAPALFAGFTNWDDDIGLVNNPYFRGLAWPNLRWMFTTFLLGHYQPLAWLSLGADYTVWGMNPFGFHLTSVLFHAANGVLLFFVIGAVLRLAGAPAPAWVTAVGALVYAIHPQRVESVVWVTERRDVLCGFFTLLSLLFYLRRVEEERRGRPGTRWLLISVIAFGAALASKSLSIMLPAVLLILDVYPLRRFVAGSRGRVLLEKVPYGVLSCVDGVVMLFAMNHINALRTVETYNLSERIAQAAYGLCLYLRKAACPTGLIPIYRLETPMNPWAAKYIVAMIAVAAISGFLVAVRRRSPAGLVAWLCFIILLLPVLGIVVTGKQVAADRYTYLALIPLSVLVSGLLNRAPFRIAMAAGATVLVALSAMTIRQCGFWKDSVALWSREIEMDPGCDTAFQDRGQARSELGDSAGAMADCTRCLELSPRSFKAYNLRGFLRQKAGDRPGARADYDRALEILPNHILALTNRGDLRRSEGDLQGALDDAEAALRNDPGSGTGYFLRASVFLKLGRYSEALRDYDRAAFLLPDDPRMLVGRGQARLLVGDRVGATADLMLALSHAPPNWPLRAEVESLIRRLNR